MQKFKIKIYGPSKSNPTDVFWYSRDTLRGFGFHEGSKVAVNWAEVDEILEESEEFQEMIKESGLFVGDIMNERPSSLYEMIYPSERISQYLEVYASRDRLNELLEDIYETYSKMADEISNVIDDIDSSLTSAVYSEDGGNIEILIVDDNDLLSKKKIKEVLTKVMKDYLSGLDSPISYNFVIKGIKFFSAELEVSNPDCIISES